jgi:soluble lytic murein transglycosylase-like protein
MRRTCQFALAAALVALLPPAARAGERVTLANGFSLTCNHHQSVDGRVRLYTSTDAESYIEFPPADIATIETVADPPSAPSLPAAAPEPPAATPLAASSSARNGKLTPADLHQMLSSAGAAHNLDVDLLASVVKAESDGNARARSRAGAQGLMQLMPATAAQLGVHDSFEPQENVQGGSAYLDALLTRYHDNLAIALAAYNAGPAAVDKYRGIPPYRETRVYVARVIHEFNRRVLARERASVSRASSGQ